MQDKASDVTSIIPSPPRFSAKLLYRHIPPFQINDVSSKTSYVFPRLAR